MNKKATRVCAAVLAAAILIIGASGCSKTKGLDSSEPEIINEVSLDVTSFDKFREAAGNYGEVYDMTEVLEYQAAAVSSEDINLIYMMLDDAAAAKSMAMGDLGAEGIELKVIDSGENYEYYEETADETADTGIGSIYGLYLRVDNMLILATGSLDDKGNVRNKAVEFYKSLGYPAV